MAFSDEQVVEVLDDVIAIADPIIDVLKSADVFGAKATTYDDPGDDAAEPSRFDKVRSAIGGGLGRVDWPGTAGWDDLNMNQRADWWKKRIGAVNTVGVAFPHIFGAWTRKLPVNTYLGFANQVLVLRAVGREFGVTSREAGIKLLGSILLGRDLDPAMAEHAAAVDLPTEEKSRTRALLTGMWEIAKYLRNLTNELGRRPNSPKSIRWLSWIPLVGMPATYVGERLALRRAVKETKQWILEHPAYIDS